MENTSILIVSIIFLSVVRKSVSVDCYICGTITSLDEECEDPFKSEGVFKFPCGGSCAKYKGEKGDTQVVWRTCVEQRLPDRCERQTQLGVNVNVCYCNVDKCNAATTSRQSYAVTHALTLVLVNMIVVYMLNVT